MAYYAFIENGVLNGGGECICIHNGLLSYEISKEVYDNLDHYMWNGEDVVINPNYEQEQALKEHERVGHLKCTKRVLALILEQLGFSYANTIKPLIESSPQASLEWELCVELERSNPLLDIFGLQLGITPEQIDNIFKYANGELDTLEVEE